MAQVIITCPYCHAQNISMDILGVQRTKTPDSREYASEPIGNGHSKHIYSHTANGVAICGKCQNPVGLSFSWKNETAAKDDPTEKNLLALGTADALGVAYKLIPFPQQNAELKHLPPEVAKAFAQAEKNMQMEDCEEIAAIACRRVIELAITAQYPRVSGKNLKEKIDALEAQNLIPAAMKDWAHESRIIGNDGAHDTGVTRADAEAAQAFTAAFLQYAVSLPEEIAQRRGQTPAPATQPAAPQQQALPAPAKTAQTP